VTLPDWTAEGLLPEGVHRASMADVYERFVEDAPERSHREMLFSALQTYMMLVSRFVPAGRAWIDGGFGTRKEPPPMTSTWSYSLTIGRDWELWILKRSPTSKVS
jgi:hypothetical protein